MIGATGAVGGHTFRTLLKIPELEQLTLLGRRPVADVQNDAVQQHMVDLFDPSSYTDFITGHQIAICTLGVGQTFKNQQRRICKNR